MTCPDSILPALLVLLGGVAPAFAADTATGDTVTLVNGDIYIGEVLEDELNLATEIGRFTIPVERIRSIEMDHVRSLARIRTHAEEQLDGRIIEEDIRFSRLQDPTLPLSIGDIDNLLLSPPETTQASSLQGWLETVSGNRIEVRARFEILELQTPEGNQRFDVSDLRYIDTSLHSFDNRLLTQITLSDGTPVQGQLTSDTLPLHSSYRANLELSPDKLSRLTLVDPGPPLAGNGFQHSLRAMGPGPEMIKLPGGSFLRGDYQGDGDDDEQPLTEIRLRPFAIGRFEVSFDEYDLYCGRAPGCQLPDDQGWGRGNRPVVNVSWLEARAYTNWLAEHTGQPYRLPSDAEWEYAHRAGRSSRYHWGDDVGQARANCEGCGSLWDGDKTAPKGRFEPNAFGLYDTAGNVFEWVADCFTDQFADAPPDGAPVEKPGCGKRVIRGGAWSFPPHEIRSANRWRDFPSRRSDDTGFRIALDLE